MFINLDEFERRRMAENNLVLRLEIPEENEPREIKAPVDRKKFTLSGVQTGQAYYTTEEKILIGTTAQLLGPKAAGEILDVNPKVAGSLGMENYKAKDADEVRAGIYAALESIRETARQKLIMALGLIDEETLEAIPIKDRAKIGSQIANQLSGVIDRTIEKAGLHLDNSKTAHLHLYSPEIRAMDQFQIKRVNGNGQSDGEAKVNQDGESLSE